MSNNYAVNTANAFRDVKCYLFFCNGSSAVHRSSMVANVIRDIVNANCWLLRLSRKSGLDSLEWFSSKTQNIDFQE